MKKEKIDIEALKFAAEVSRARSIICYTRKTNKYPNWTDCIPLATYNECGKKNVMFMKLYEDGSFDICF